MTGAGTTGPGPFDVAFAGAPADGFGVLYYGPQSLMPTNELALQLSIPLFLGLDLGTVMHNLRGRILSDLADRVLHFRGHLRLGHAVLLHLGGGSGCLLDLCGRVLPGSYVNVFLHRVSHILLGPNGLILQLNHDKLILLVHLSPDLSLVPSLDLDSI